MNETEESKRYTLAVTLIRMRTAQALYDLAEMFIRRMQKLHYQGKETLETYRRQHQEQTDTLISLLGQIAQSWQSSELPEQRLKAIDNLIGNDADSIREQCDIHLGYAGNNYLPFLQPLYGTQRISMTYNSALRRYFLTTSHLIVGSKANLSGGEVGVFRRKRATNEHTSALGVFDAPEPWGLWTTVYYDDDWCKDCDEPYHTYYEKFPTKWMSKDGKIMYICSSQGMGATTIVSV